MVFETIVTRKSGAAFIITLNRPRYRNAVSLRMMNEISAAAREAGNESEVRAAIITGGVDCFSSGADLNDVRALKSLDESVKYFARWHLLTTTLEKLSKPVIAAIEGPCITGGCELALACDIRIAGAAASFAITSSRIGTLAGAGGTQRLPRLIGTAKALEMMFSSEAIDADEAYRIGLVNRLAPAGAALEAACAMASLYAQRAPLSLAMIKRAVHQGMQMDLASGLELETSLAAAIYSTEDKAEGVAAFIEKREPHFKGR